MRLRVPSPLRGATRLVVVVWLVAIGCRPAADGTTGPGTGDALAVPVAAGHAVVDVAIAPDSSSLAYAAVANGRLGLFLRRLDQFEIEPIADTDGATQPFFAPDGSEIAFFADGMLKRVRLDGSAPIDICEVSGATAGGSWGPDGRIVFAPLTGQGLLEVPADGGSPLPLTNLDDAQAEVAHGWPHLLPGGQAVLFTVGRDGRNPRLAWLSLETGARVDLVPIEGGAAFVDAGYAVYTRRGELMALELDPASGSAVGAPRVIGAPADSTPAGHRRLGRSSLAAGRDGALVYSPLHEEAAETELVWVERDGRAAATVGDPGILQTPRLSPDRTRIVATARVDAFTRDLWLLDVDAGHGRPLTAGAGDNHSPVWSPTGDTITFASNRDGPQRIYRMSIDDPDAAETLLYADARTPGSWSPDGRILVFHETHADRARDIWHWSGSIGDEPRRLVATPANERAPALSPDGRWLAYVSDTHGDDQVFVEPYPPTVARRAVSLGGGTEPVWSPVGDALFYRRAHGVHVATIDPETGIDEVRHLFDGAYVADPDGHLAAYDVGTDGSRLLMLRSTRQLAHLHLRRGWDGPWLHQGGT